MACPFCLVSLATTWRDTIKNLNVVSGFNSFQWLLLRGDWRKLFSKVLPLSCFLAGYQLRDVCGLEDENNLWILLNRGIFLPFSLATYWGGTKKCFRFFEYNANFPPSRWLPIEGCLRFGGWKQSVNYIEQGCLFAVFVGYYLKDILKNSFWNNAVRCHRSV